MIWMILNYSQNEKINDHDDIRRLVNFDIIYN